MTTFRTLILSTLFVGVGVAGAWYYLKPVPVPLPTVGPTMASAAKYVAPLERSLDMQLFDKALLYLMDVQEADGHFDSAKTGAAPEYCNLNNDIAITSIAAWVLMGSSSGVNQNKEAVTRARKAIKWLESKIKPDGTIADIGGPGDAATAQFFASDVFRMAVTYSMRESLRDEANRLNTVALLKMKADHGGYGPLTNSEEPTPEMLALSTFVYKFAGLDGFKFDALSQTNATPAAVAKAQKSAFPIEDEIIDNIRAGLFRMSVNPANSSLSIQRSKYALWGGGVLALLAIIGFFVRKRPGKRFSFRTLELLLITTAAGLLVGGGVCLRIAENDISTRAAEFTKLGPAAKFTSVFAAEPGGPADWRATVCCMQSIFLLNQSRANVNPLLEYVFGTFDQKTESYPRILENIKWGAAGEGYDALELWQGSIAVVYIFTEDKYESKSWIGNLRRMLQEHQSPDGSWPVAGIDAKRGIAWRTGLHAMTLALTAPPPPPPPPPPENQPSDPPPEKPVPQGKKK